MPNPSPLPPSMSDRPARLLAYRVNRRPIGEHTLLPETPPLNPFEHFVRVLAPGYTVTTSGKGHDRVWRTGALQIDDSEQFVTGKLGWYPLDKEVVTSWSPELQDWPPTLRDPGETLMPFVFDGTTRLLGVVHDKRTSPTTIATVFEMILRANERELPVPTTEWSVEPVLDSTEFIDWLHTLDVVESVGFVARLPNPEPDSAFEELTGRLERAHGTEYSARMKSNRDEGLQDIEDDPEFTQAIAMGEKGFAQLDGRGRRGGREVRYSQRERIASEDIDWLPESWEEARNLLKMMVRESLSRFLRRREDGAA